MKTILTLLAVTAISLVGIQQVRADNHEKTLKGDGLCAKCELKETEKCQTAIRVKESDKTVIYYAKDNKVATDFHKHLCTSVEKVVATGEVKEVDGKKHITLTKIELEKK